jgi:hypothetical protein
MVKMRRELEAPCAAEHEIEEYRSVVHFLGVEMGAPPETPGVFWVVALLARAEEGEVPVFGDVPVEGVERVDEDGDKPDICVGRRVSIFRLR